MLDPLRNFFAVNGMIVQFAHGQVYFLLGVIMLVQWRQRSRLELASGLPWLAAFGLLEAVAVWTGAFLSLQAGQLDAGATEGLRLAQLFIQVCTFAALLGYGLQLTEPRLLRPAMVLLPLGLTVLFGALLLFQSATGAGLDPSRANSIEAATRYLVCAPAALLTAFGLRRRAGRLLGPLRQENIISDLRVAGFGFVFYALVEGVLVPPAPFFPATVLNDQMLYAAIGIPIGIVRAAMGAVILLFFFRALEVFLIETGRAQEDLARQQSLNAERERISRDLHDGTLQNIYASGLVLEDVRHAIAAVRERAPLAAPEPLDRAQAQLDAAIHTLDATVEGIRTTIYDLRTVPPNEDLARAMIEILSEFRLRTGMQTDWHVEGEPCCALHPDKQQHVYQIMREALSNAARHSRAKRVEVRLAYASAGAAAGNGSERPIRLTISDNGTGEVPPVGRVGRGLQNMRERAQLLGAQLSVVGTPGSGTTVTLEFG